MPATFDLGPNPTVARSISATGTSAGVTLTAGCRRISIVAHGANLLFKTGQGAQTATASDHFILNGERLVFDIPKNSSIAAIRHGGTSGTLEISEFA